MVIEAPTTAKPAEVVLPSILTDKGEENSSTSFKVSLPLISCHFMSFHVGLVGLFRFEDGQFSYYNALASSDTGKLAGRTAPHFSYYS